MNKKLLYLLLVLLISNMKGEIFINEIDYDQPSTDASEFIELSAPAGTYSNVNLKLMNGNNNSEYGSYNLGTVSFSDEGQGYGFYVIGSSAISNVDFSSGFPSSNAIQNGDPDGVELWVNGQIVDAVSYAGEMYNSEGDIMQQATPNDTDDEFWEGGESLSISRLGVAGSPWSVMSSTPGLVNENQILDPNANFSPNSSAGNDQIVSSGDLVTLDGSESFDNDGYILSYLWEQISGVDVVLSIDDQAITTFMFPQVIETTELVFELTVTDDEGASNTDEIIITVYFLQQVEIYEIQENISNYEGQQVNVVGVVTIGDNLLYPGKTKFFIQDNSGRGIQIYNDTVLEVQYNRGDLIEVIGMIEIYNDDVEITNPIITLIDTDYNLPEPYEIQGIETVSMNGTWAIATGVLSDYWHYTSGSTEFTALTITSTNGSETQTMFWNSAVPALELTQFEEMIGEELAISGVVSFYNSAVQLTCGYFIDIQSNVDPNLPIADAGDDQIVSLGEIVYLDASASFDSGSIVAYEWVQLDGPAVNLEDEENPITSFTAPAENSIITFRLTIWDDEINEDTDQLTIVVQEPGSSMTIYDIIHNCGSGVEILACDGQYDLSSSSASGCPLYETNVITTGTIIDYFDITPFNGPHSFTIEDENGNLIDFVVWPESSEYQDGFDITQTELNILTQPPFGIYSVQITGELGAYCDDDELLDINSEWQITVEYETNIQISTEEASEDILPRYNSLSQNFPNPFNPETMIEFNIKDRDRINISIFDLKGNIVSNLIDNIYTPGHYSIIWNGENINGNELPSGLYFYQLKTSTDILTKRMLLVR